MKTAEWLLIVFFSGIPLFALQGTTPQAALEELANTTKPEVIARHLPEPVQKRIEELPKLKKQEVMNQLLEMKSSHLNGCTVRPASHSDGWEILDEDGDSKGTVKIANAFFSGTEALLPLEIKMDDSTQSFIVTMRLEDNEWRIDDFGPWEKNDLGLEKLLHQPTEMEKNEAAAYTTLIEIMSALRQYAFQHIPAGFPAELSALTDAVDRVNNRPPLDHSFAADPLVKDGYQFRYVRIALGGDGQGPGDFELTATPVEFGKTGSKNYLADFYQLHVTMENRPATKEDPPAREQ
ncbi:MAG TPA: hypothetical protein VKH81_17620 [Candidatus Angelobacter sp.]|nr:hypothetical protein [Candidatus Angelobacter sp.]